MKKKYRAAVAGLVLNLLSYDTPVFAGNPETVHTVIRVNYVLPSCEITVPPTIKFGNVLKGSTKTTNFNITVECVPYVNVSTRVRMALAPGYTSEADGSVKVHQAGSTVTNGVLLRLYSVNDGGGQITPFVSGVSGYFCGAMTSGPRTCVVAATLDATAPGVVNGPMEAEVIFDVDVI